jgi:hypothetical protein
MNPYISRLVESSYDIPLVYNKEPAELPKNPSGEEVFEYLSTSSNTRRNPIIGSKGYIAKKKWNDLEINNNEKELKSILDESNKSENTDNLINEKLICIRDDEHCHGVYIPYGFYKHIDAFIVYIQVKDLQKNIFDTLRLAYIKMIHDRTSYRAFGCDWNINLVLCKLIGLEIQEINEEYLVPILLSIGGNDYMLDKTVHGYQLEIAGMDKNDAKINKIRCLATLPEKINDKNQINKPSEEKKIIEVQKHGQVYTGNLLEFSGLCTYIFFTVDSIWKNRMHNKDYDIENICIEEFELSFGKHYKIVWKKDEIITIEVFGNKYYGIPLSPALNTKSKLKEFLLGNNVPDVYGINFSSCPCHVNIKTDVDNHQTIFFNVWALSYSVYKVERGSGSLNYVIG